MMGSDDRDPDVYQTLTMVGLREAALQMIELVGSANMH
jgi:hypothetical protein